jgi:o-succinylbenzoate synthase
MIQYSYIKHQLAFNFDAKTSRGEIKKHDAYIIIAKDAFKKVIGIGEASPLAGLSIDSTPDFEMKLDQILNHLNEGIAIDEELELNPSIQFALESIQLDIKFGSIRKYFDSTWLKGESIKINGLVWMNRIDEMLNEAISKFRAGFDCIKFKIGALDFDEECNLLEKFRKVASESKVQIRVDANGAFHVQDALLKLNELKRFQIHSIEQPIKPNLWDEMQELIAKSPIKIALDEELIGLNPFESGKSLMEYLNPDYLILKPTLIGGLKVADEWIKLAQIYDKDWWATSALESNIGLNIIAQWSSSKNPKLHQGLGTGSLYSNNFPAPFKVEKGFLSYISDENWKFPQDWNLSI